MQATHLHHRAFVYRFTLTCFVLICATALPDPAWASKSAKSQKTSQKSKTVRVKHSQNNSGETQSERDRRLYRECKGLPNAGACLGYTR